MTPRIAMVSLSPLMVGGIETHLLQIFRGLRDEFEFVAIGTLAEPFRSQAEALGARCIALPAAGKANPAMLARLVSLFRDERIDIVHTHDTRGGLLGRLAAKLASRRAIHTVHTPSFFLPSRPAVVQGYRLAERILNQFASNRVVFVSEAIRRIYLEGHLVPTAKAIYIPNGLETTWFTSAPVQPPQHAGVSFLYIGRLSPEKGLDILGEAFGLLARKRPDFKLRVVGCGSESIRLQQLATDGGWGAQLDLAGSVPREDARAALLTSDVFVLPSRYESMSYTLLEAMACGRPIIATDVGGNCDLVEPGRTGMLVPSCDPAALAEAMLYLADHPQAREEFGREGWKKAQRYTLDSMIQSVRTVYRELI
jgi:glycosyltransferase involved in cell wall biosynthesis